MVKSYVVGGGSLLDYIVSFLGQVIVIVISRPRSLTIKVYETQSTLPGASPFGGHSPLNKKSVCVTHFTFIWIFWSWALHTEEEEEEEKHTEIIHFRL